MDTRGRHHLCSWPLPYSVIGACFLSVKGPGHQLDACFEWTYAYYSDPLLKQSVQVLAVEISHQAIMLLTQLRIQAISFFFLLVICTSGVRCILENVNTSYGRSTQHPPSWLLLRAVHCCRVQLTWKGQLEISTSSHELKNAKISGKNATFPNLTFCTIEGWKDKIRLHLYRFIQRYYWQNFDTQQV